MSANKKPTYMEADKAASTLRAALAGHRGDVTIADAATRSGLALRDAETGLHRLVAVHRGHLAVTGDGTLLFRFPDGFRIDWERRGRMARAFRAAGRVLLAAAKVAARMAITVLLVGYALLYVLIIFLGSIALSIAAEDSGPLEVTALLFWALGELVVDALFWTAHPMAPFDPMERVRRRAARKGTRLTADDAEKDENDENDEKKKVRKKRHLYQRVNGFFLGLSAPREDPLEQDRLLLEQIRAGRGVIGLGDVLRITGGSRAAAEATLSRLLLDHDGEVQVTDDGAILYRFPAVRKTATRDSTDVAPTPIWKRPVPVLAFTGNSFGSNAAVVAMTAFNGGMGWLGVWLELPIFLAEIPFLLAAGLLCIPILRLPFWFSGRVSAQRENGRRALLGKILGATALHSADGGIERAALLDAWRDGASRRPTQKRLTAAVMELGADVDVESPEADRLRFVDLGLESRALEKERAAAPEAERDAGAVELASYDP